MLRSFYVSTIRNYPELLFCLYTVTPDKCFSELGLCKSRVAPMIATDVSVLMGVSQPMVRFNVF